MDGGAAAKTSESDNAMNAKKQPSQTICFILRNKIGKKRWILNSVRGLQRRGTIDDPATRAKIFEWQKRSRRLADWRSA
jgi:hypothetical protein